MSRINPLQKFHSRGNPNAAEDTATSIPKVVKTLADLDEMLKRFDEAALISDDERRKEFTRYRMDFDNNVPIDPYSEEYCERQLELYRRIAGRSYSAENEVSEFSVLDAVSSPFPYHTASCGTVGDHLMAIGHAIKRINLRPPAKIVEFGPGWGNTTLALAMMGFDVTAVDIERNFCDLLTQRAERQGISINVVNADFFWIETLAEPVDAVLFFECFHHCSDHLRLLRALSHAVKPDGRVYFASEPITTDFPIPWGLRLDGESLWAIRRNGWLELGFNEKYFIDTMATLGWTVNLFDASEPGWASVYEAVRTHAGPISFAAGDPRIQTAVGSRAQRDIIVSCGLEGYLLFGPYITLSQGRYSARIHLSVEHVIKGTGLLDVCHCSGTDILAYNVVDFSVVEMAAPFIEINFSLSSTVNDLEIRLLCNKDTAVAIRSVDIVRCTA